MLQILKTDNILLNNFVPEALLVIHSFPSTAWQSKNSPPIYSTYKKQFVKVRTSTLTEATI